MTFMASVEAPALELSPTPPVPRFDIARFQDEQVAIIRDRYQTDEYYRYIANRLGKLPRGQSPTEPDPSALQICGITMRVVSADGNNGSLHCKDCDAVLNGEYVRCSRMAQSHNGDEKEQEQKHARCESLNHFVDKYDLCAACGILAIMTSQANGSGADRGGGDQRRRTAERRLFAHDHFLKHETHKVKFITLLISTHQATPHTSRRSHTIIEDALRAIETQNQRYEQIDEALQRLLPTQVQRVDEVYQQICMEIERLNVQCPRTMRTQLDHLRLALKLEKARHDALLFCRGLERRQHIINNYYASVQNLIAHRARVNEISWNCTRCETHIRINRGVDGNFCPQCGCNRQSRKEKSWTQWTTAECVHHLQVFVDGSSEVTLTSMAQVCGTLKARHVTGDKLASFKSRDDIAAIGIYDTKDQDALVQWAEYVQTL